ncbi:hypothetical protein TSOC_009354 [Tetrabaena socialis]|uniref:Uncharacterized protein n=1 Tax=Tetrabaena socialis TaxID=47790 RepID=A0A2J7ZW31_9CHLO|nr:hypothetical protein TSOC_009354 [Tetrabaena socialis]|eukprot:PNH04477.1 hypothetical protein TSOC_009354 [Tetrabaena socialis]
MAAMNIPSCVMTIAEETEGFVNGAASRPLPGGGEGATQTLLACGHKLWPLEGAGSRGRLEVGPRLTLYSHPASRDGRPAAERRPYDTDINGVTWDAHSSALYLTQGPAVMRVSSDDTAAVVAGALDERGGADGRGSAARFIIPELLASDGAGALYVADGDRIRKLQLPPVPGQQGNRGEALGSQLAGGTGAAGGAA